MNGFGLSSSLPCWMSGKLVGHALAGVCVFLVARGQTLAQSQTGADLKAAQAELRITLHRLYEVTPRSAELRREQEAWALKQSFTPSLESVKARITELGRLGDATEAAMSRRFTRQDIAQRCIPVPEPGGTVPKPECSPTAFGRVNGDSTLFYQTYCFHDDDCEMSQDGATATVVLSRTAPQSKEFQILGWTDRTVNQPVMIYSEKFGELLLMPGTPMGAAGRWFSDSVYEMEEPSGFGYEVDVESWKDDVESRLPKGLSINHDSRVDYQTGTVTLDLMRESDPMSTPTGGRAIVKLLIKNRRLVVDRMWIAPGNPER